MLFPCCTERQPRNASPVPDCNAPYLCAFATQPLTQRSSRKSCNSVIVDTAVTKSQKLYAGKSRAHAAFTIVCHAMENSVHNLFQGLGSTLNSGRSDSFHPSLARRACKSSVTSAIYGVVFSRILQAGGSRHVSQSLTAQQRRYARNLQLRTELGIRCPIPCTSASPSTLSQHPQISRVEAFRFATLCEMTKVCGASPSSQRNPFNQRPLSPKFARLDLPLPSLFGMTPGVLLGIPSASAVAQTRFGSYDDVEQLCGTIDWEWHTMVPDPFDRTAWPQCASVSGHIRSEFLRFLLGIRQHRGVQ